MSRDEEFMRCALAEAEFSYREDELPVGAILVHNGIIISATHKKKSDNSRLDHAEIKALRHGRVGRGSKKWAHEMTIYTTLEPCIMCFGALMNCRIGRIVYAMEDLYGGLSELPTEVMPLRHREECPEVVGGVLRAEARMLFRDFFLRTKQKFWQNKENPLVKSC